MKFVKVFLVIAVVVFLTFEYSEAGSKKSKESKEKLNKNEKYNKDEKYSKDGKYNKHNEKQKKQQRKEEEVVVEDVDADTVGEVQVKLSHGGEVVGTTLSSYKGKRFFAFRGIPYAEPPTGDLRFKAPLAKVPWAAGVPLDATKDGQPCPQVNFITNAYEGQEDCLILNVYTPQLPEPEEEEEEEEDESLPVLVWIHGGGFAAGSSESTMYGPKFLMDQRVILVTVNYRLGALGFLSTNDAASPGNYGLLDQSLALRWVKENIAEFAGDPNRVTIFGESAGGASIDYHLLSPASSGLFHRAISMSGSPLCLWAFGKPHQVTYWANKLGTAVGCPNTTTDELITCLRGIPVKTILDTSLSFAKSGMVFPLIFNPTVDGQFLKEEPMTMLSSGKIPNRVPVIHGITSKEGLFLLEIIIKGNPNPNFTDKTFVTDLTNYMIDNLGQQTEASNLVYEAYYSSIDKNDPTAAKRQAIDIFSHGMIDACHYQTVQLLTKAGISTYVYSYNYKAEGLDILGSLFGIDNTLGVGHIAELGALFRMELPGLPVMPVSPNDENVVSNFTTLFTNFAARGNPTPLTRRKKFAVEWLQTEETPISVFNIDSEHSISTYDPSTDPNFDLWTKQVPELMKKSQQEQKAAKEEL